jgi:hypothetical protein
MEPANDGQSTLRVARAPFPDPREPLPLTIVNRVFPLAWEPRRDPWSGELSTAARPAIFSEWALIQF